MVNYSLLVKHIYMGFGLYIHFWCHIQCCINSFVMYLDIYTPNEKYFIADNIDTKAALNSVLVREPWGRGNNEMTYFYLHLLRLGIMQLPYYCMGYAIWSLMVGKNISMQAMWEMFCMKEFSVPAYDDSYRWETTPMQSLWESLHQ